MATGKSTAVFLSALLLLGGGALIGNPTVGEVTAAANQPADITVTDATTLNETVTRGETGLVRATVENQGDLPGTAPINLEIDGTIVDGKFVELDGNESTVLEFAHEFDTPGERTVTVNGVLAGAVSVLAPPAFEVNETTLGTGEIQAGAAVNITATVTNTGDVEGTYDARLQVDGQTRETKAVTVPGDSSRAVSFRQRFETAGEYAVSVGDSTSKTLTVRQPAEIAVVEAETNTDELTTAESLTVEATIENTGEVSGEREISLQVDGSVVQSKSVTLAGGETRVVNFTHQFSEAGQRTVTVGGVSAGDVSVLTPAQFEISNPSVSDIRVLEGEAVTVTARVENVGDATEIFRVRLSVDGDAVESRQVTLEGGESRRISFEQSFTAAGRYDLSVNGRDAGTVSVDRQAALAVTATSLTDTVIAENGSVGISATVENAGDRAGVYTAELLIDGRQRATRDVAVADGRTATVNFTHRFDEAGIYNVSVGGVEAGQITVERPASIELLRADLTRERVPEGATVGIIADVTNSGDRNGTFTVTVAVDGEIRTQRTLTVPAGATEQIRLNQTFEEIGSYAITVNEQAAGTVVVAEPPSFEVQRAVVPADWAAAGTETILRVVVKNPGNWTVTQPLNVTVDGQRVVTERVTLAAGERRSVEIPFAASNGTVAVEGVQAGRLSASNFFENNSTDGSEATAGGGGLSFLPILALLVVAGTAGLGWFALLALGIVDRER